MQPVEGSSPTHYSVGHVAEYSASPCALLNMLLLTLNIAEWPSSRACIGLGAVANRPGHPLYVLPALRTPVGKDLHVLVRTPIFSPKLSSSSVASLYIAQKWTPAEDWSISHSASYRRDGWSEGPYECGVSFRMFVFLSIFSSAGHARCIMTCKLARADQEMHRSWNPQHAPGK